MLALAQCRQRLVDVKSGVGPWASREVGFQKSQCFTRFLHPEAPKTLKNIEIFEMFGIKC